MRLTHCSLISAGLLMLAVPAVAIGIPKHGSSKLHTHASVNHTLVRHKKTVAHGIARHETATVAMPSERATQIQTALIKQGYLSGEPSGAWDSQTVAAMEKLQADNGWQSKVTPDSRALIKLGLGPEQASNRAPNSPQ